MSLSKESRRIAIEAEDAFASTMEGREVYRNGWPDFLCVGDDRITAVEVKSGNGRLTKEQCAVMNVLASSGIDCYVWHPRQGFTLYQEGKRAKPKVYTTRVVKMERYSEAFSRRVMEEHRRVTGRGLTPVSVRA